MIALLRDERMRPTLKTPPKGSEGDRCIESEVGETDIPTILRKYAGNLQELLAWRGNLSYGVQPSDDLEEVLQSVERIKEIHRNSGSELSFNDWIKDVLTPKPISQESDKVSEEKNETNENKEIHQ